MPEGTFDQIQAAIREATSDIDTATGFILDGIPEGSEAFMGFASQYLTEAESYLED